MKSPLEIEVLLHYYVSPSQHPHINTTAVQEAIEMYQHERIMEPVNYFPGYIVTSRGRAWIGMILRTPYPIHAWLDPDKKEIVKEA